MGDFSPFYRSKMVTHLFSEQYNGSFVEKIHFGIQQSYHSFSLFIGSEVLIEVYRQTRIHISFPLPQLIIATFINLNDH